MKRSAYVLLVISLALASCSKGKHGKEPANAESPGGQTAVSAGPGDTADFAIALREGRFEDAGNAADSALAKQAGNPVALVVRAVVRYRSTMLALLDDLRGVAESADNIGSFDHDKARAAYARTEKALAEIDRDLEVAGAASDFALTLCLACWQEDWNRNGRMDDGDELLLQIEVDSKGEEIPEGDPRRKPTFRFDQGDVYWARAMLAFQRALLDLVLAYRWNELDKLIDAFDADPPPKITIRLADRERVKGARELVVKALDLADRARELYLAETDDDREWVPNPNQKNHPLPLPVDAALYDTWKGVIGDARRLLDDGEGISMREVAMLLDDDWPSPPQGYIDLGGLLSKPQDVVLDFSVLMRADPDEPGTVDAALRSLLGEHYKSEMKPSPLVGRFARMKREIEQGEDSLDRKLRYLFWLN